MAGVLDGAASTSTPSIASRTAPPSATATCAGTSSASTTRCDGLRLLADRYPQVESIGIDTWGVDYALLDDDGPAPGRSDRLPRRPHRHRRRPACTRASPRTSSTRSTGCSSSRSTRSTSSRPSGTGRTGPKPPTSFSSPTCSPTGSAASCAPRPPTPRPLGSLDVRTGDVVDRPPRPARAPDQDAAAARATRHAPGRCDGGRRDRLRPVARVTTVGSHDTASAVVGVPATHRRFAYIASGTWSLVGLELDEPVLTDESRPANFTNEARRRRHHPLPPQRRRPVAPPGVERTWAEQGAAHDLTRCSTRLPTCPRADRSSTSTTTSFIPPGDMPDRSRSRRRTATGGRPTRPPRSAASSTRSPRPTPGRSIRPPSSPATRSTSCTSSAGARRTPCSASSRPTCHRSAGRGRDPSRPPPWATCSYKRGPTAPRPLHSTDGRPPVAAPLRTSR